MPLSDIVNVTITALTTAPTRTGFGTPMVSAFIPTSIMQERAREYSSVAAMVTDGFAVDHPAVRAVTALLSQNPKPSKVIVGREANTAVKKVTFTPVTAEVIEGAVFDIYLDGNLATYTAGVTPTPAQVTAGLKAAIDLLSLSLSTTDGAGTLDVQASAATANFSHYVGDRNLMTQADVTADGGGGGIVADLVAIGEANNDWYSYHPTANAKAVILAAAAYIETLIKVMGTSNADDDILTAVSTDLISALNTAGYARTFCMYHQKASVQYAGAAWAGVCLPLDPGSITWKFQTLAGVDVSVLTDTERTNIKNKKGNWYESVAGISITQEGWTAAGEFIDITRGIDFIRARMQETVFATLANAGKIPYTDKGVAIIENDVTSVLTLAVGNDILSEDPAPVVTVPKVADVAFADKAERLLPDVEFTGTLAGAIHKVVISGVVSV